MIITVTLVLFIRIGVIQHDDGSHLYKGRVYKSVILSRHVSMILFK